MPFPLPTVYAITDQKLSGLPHSHQVKLLAEGGVKLIQLRDKDSSPREFQLEAVKALAIARPLGVKVIINDRVDIALAISADGVHLGQDDLPAAAAHRLLGEQAIIGFSTHRLDQALNAAHEPVSYIAVGPIFATSSKIDTEPVLGLDGLAVIRRHLQGTPLVAIGGISEKNAIDVLRAGADSVAVISSLLNNPARI